MSEQEETNGTEEMSMAEAMEQHPVSPEELGEVPNEGTETYSLSLSVLGKITWNLEGEIEVADYVASTGADWVTPPPKTISQGQTGEFEVLMEILEGDEFTGTVHLSDTIALSFDINGGDNAAHSSQKVIGPIVHSSISPGHHCIAEFVIDAGGVE